MGGLVLAAVTEALTVGQKPVIGIYLKKPLCNKGTKFHGLLNDAQNERCMPLS